MSRINNQIQHKISEITLLGQKKTEAQEEARNKYKEQHGNLEGYNISKTQSIRSINTAKTYRKTGEQFAKWLKDEKGINKIKLVTADHAGEYLQIRQEKGISPWTIKSDMAALNKIFGFDLKSKALGLRERKIKNIKRSRSGPDKSRPGIEIKFKDQIMLIKACGCRRSSVTKITYNDIIFKNGQATAVKLTEKGGKFREAPVLEIFKKEFTAMIKKYSGTQKSIFDKLDSHVAAHYYRHLYAKNLYKELCEKIAPTGNLYKGYRVEVLKEVSKAIGHNRINVVVDNYLNY